MQSQVVFQYRPNTFDDGVRIDDRNLSAYGPGPDGVFVGMVPVFPMDRQMSGRNVTSAVPNGGVPRQRPMQPDTCRMRKLKANRLNSLLGRKLFV